MMMRKADVFMHDIHAGVLEEITPRKAYRFTYDPAYDGPPVSLTAPVRHEPYEYDTFPPFLEGLLPEGYNLEALLRALKIDRHDHFSQLLAVGKDMVGAVTVQETR
jgi:serine/threonine-protein kinase HipA